jgi:hypothetical protein
MTTVQRARIVDDQGKIEESLPCFDCAIAVFEDLGARWELGDRPPSVASPNVSSAAWTRPRRISAGRSASPRSSANAGSRAGRGARSPRSRNGEATRRSPSDGYDVRGRRRPRDRVGQALSELENLGLVVVPEVGKLIDHSLLSRFKTRDQGNQPCPDRRRQGGDPFDQSEEVIVAREAQRDRGEPVVHRASTLDEFRGALGRLLSDGSCLLPGLATDDLRLGPCGGVKTNCVLRERRPRPPVDHVADGSHREATALREWPHPLGGDDRKELVRHQEPTMEDDQLSPLIVNGSSDGLPSGPCKLRRFDQRRFHIVET